MADTMDHDMDIDMDIDLTADPEIAALEAEAMKIQARTAEAAEAQGDNSVPQQEEEEDKSRPVPTKVNIRGLDHFTTQDIRQFASEHYSTEELQQRIEWIDDTSANVVYNTEEAAAAALKAFTDLAESIPEQLSSLQSRRAKPLSTHPDTNLEVRLATAGDVKAPRAHERSRFYLMNPEHDPRERRRDYDDRRGRGNGRRPDRRRRDEPVPQKFDVSMYDDDQGEEAGEVEPRATSFRRDDDRQQRRRQRSNDQDLFADKTQGRLRDRSASPIREGDGRFGFNDDQPTRKVARRRSFTPPSLRRPQTALPPSKTGIELFPDRNKVSALDGQLHNRHSIADPIHAPPSPPRRNRELFPNKTPHSNHRRSDAMDSDETQRARRSLADRITGERTNGSASSTAPLSNGFSIRGAATSSDPGPGFSIRGASREVNAVVKELFPSKMNATAGGGGKEDLFADKLNSSRNHQRRRAEDLF